MLDQLEFLLTEALVSLRRNKWMTFAAVTTAAMALFIIGGLTSAYIGLASYAAQVESKFEMKVFVRDEATPDQAKALGERLKKLDGIKAVTFQSKKEVWETFKKENPGITAALEIDNPMPDTFTLTFTKLNKADDIAAAAKKMPEVAPKDGVQYQSEVQEFLDQTMSTIRWVGLVLGGLMLITGGILIYNTVRLTMIARRREIRIMELVGATRQTVWTPLLVEGLVQGVLGAVLATGVLWVAHSILASLVRFSIPAASMSNFALGGTLFWLILVGAVYGVGCSYLAIREPKVKEIPR